ncbi:hypothetical protein [Nostoc sp.]
MKTVLRFPQLLPINIYTKCYLRKYNGYLCVLLLINCLEIKADFFLNLMAMSTMFTELAVPLRGSKLRAASRKEVRAVTLVARHRLPLGEDSLSVVP